MPDETTLEPLTRDEIKTGTPVSGTVTRLSIAGPLVDIGLDQEALLHLSQLSTTDFKRVEEVVRPGDSIDAYVLKIDEDTGYIALTTKKPPELPWEEIRNGGVYNGKVTRIERFGAFVDIGAERPGMVHVSELTDGYVQSPQDVVSVGDVVEVRVIKLNRRQKKIDLSMRTPAEELEEAMEPDDDVPTAMALALRRAMQDSDEPMPQQGRNKRGKRNRRDNNQDDIMSRTLRNRPR
jgi:small subunit ribosomal protein S1